MTGSSDIAKCNGDACPIKLHCYRFTSVSGERQYFAEFTYDLKTGCKYFMEARQNG